MVKIDDVYFISKNVFLKIEKAKKDKALAEESVLFFVLKRISAIKKKKFKFCSSETIFVELEKSWESLDHTPAIKGDLILVDGPKKHKEEEKNCLESVSDLALREAPNTTCFLVSPDEKDSFKNLNDEMGFKGFNIKSAENFLKEWELHPFKKEMMGKILEFINQQE